VAIVPPAEGGREVGDRSHGSNGYSKNLHGWTTWDGESGLGGQSGNGTTQIPVQSQALEANDWVSRGPPHDIRAGAQSQLVGTE
jgi:hypothetical protein